MKLYHKYTVGLISLLFFSASFGLDLTIPKNLKSSLGISISDANSGQSIYEYNATAPKLIASNVKLFTTFFGLNYLGPDFHWHTQLKYSGYIHDHVLDGNLYIQGGGDPSLDSQAMYKIISILKQLDINKINGNIILDNSIFNSNPTYSMLQSNQYDADKILPSGLIIDGNRTKFTINITGDKISIKSNLTNIKIISKLSFESDNEYCSLDDTTTLNFNENTAIFQGKVGSKCNNISSDYYTFDNFNYNKIVLGKIFKNFSLLINGRFESGITPNNAKLIYDYTSQSLEHMLIDMNKYSINLYAMTIISSVGAYKTSNKATFIDGARLYYKFLKDQELLNPSFKLENGAGLSRTEYFNAEQVSDLLDNVAHSPLGVYLEASLPNAAGDGTLRNKFLQFTDRLRAKTGTLNDTRSYCGYFYSLNGHKYSVVIIADNLKTIQQKEELNKFINQLLSNLDRIDH